MLLFFAIVFKNAQLEVIIVEAPGSTPGQAEMLDLAEGRSTRGARRSSVTRSGKTMMKYE